jgi:hypothetical protein
MRRRASQERSRWSRTARGERRGAPHRFANPRFSSGTSAARVLLPVAQRGLHAKPPSVSVVIPTAGRPSILAAVSSALEQTHMPLEVIVVFDCNESPMFSALRDVSSVVRVFFTGGIGGNGARMRGVAEAKGDIVAFLDDDDVWVPEKLELQLAVWRAGSEGHRYTLVSCRIAVIDSYGRIQKTRPSRLLGAHERIAAYLFRCSSISCDVGLLHTSTLMCDRALVEMEPWDVGLSRHQDWDWVLRVGDRRDVALHMCPDVLVGVTVNDTRSVSMSGDWRASLKWLEERTDQLTARERGDFLLCFTAPMAIRSGSRRGGFIIAGRALRSGRPGIAAWLIWALHMLLVDRASALRRWLRPGTQTTWHREPTRG